MKLSDSMMDKMMRALEKMGKVVIDEQTGKSYALYNEIELGVEGNKVFLKHDGEYVSEITTDRPFMPGDTITLTNVVGFAEVSIASK